MFNGIITDAGIVKVTARASEGKKPVTYLRVVHTNWSSKDKDGNPSKTFVDITCFDTPTEAIATKAAKLQKGQRVNIQFNIQTNDVTTKSGDKRKELVLIATHMEYVSTAKKTSEQKPAETAPAAEVAAPEVVNTDVVAEANNSSSEESSNYVAPASSNADDEDDEDLPF